MAALTLALKVTSDVAYVTLMTMVRAGLVKAEWAADGRTILCFSQWGVSSLSVLMSLVLIPHSRHVVARHFVVFGNLHRYIYTVSCSSRQRSVDRRIYTVSAYQVFPRLCLSFRWAVFRAGGAL